MTLDSEGESPLKTITTSLGEIGRAIGLWLDDFWVRAQLLRAVIHETRFSFFVVVTASAALLLNDQGREIAVRGGDSPWDLLSYPLATLVLAIQCWFWARIILGQRYPRTDEKPQPAVVHVFPRLLGIASCLIPIVALAAVWRDGQAGARPILLMVTLLLTLAFFTTFVIKRRDFARAIASRAATPSNPDSYQNPYGRTFLAFSALQVIALTAWAWSAPLSIGATLGAAPVLLLGLACFVPVGSALVLWTQGTKFPVVTTMVLSGVLLSSCDPHFIRELDPVAQDARPTLTAEFARWKTGAPTLDDRPTMVVVSAAGGGITAAYWTATVLSRLAAFDPQFPARLFSISSVSGGSLGTAVFTQLLACEKGRPDAQFEQDAAAVLHGDLLAPTLGTALFNDVMFWFPPQSIAAHYEVKLPDRAVTFETQFEHQWHARVPDCRALDAPFLQQRGTDPSNWLPLMLLNSTHQETGRPVVMSQANLLVPGDSQPFESAIDYFAVAKRDLRISTAALNSARFPLVSPAGQVRYDDKPPGLRIGHLIDGGYFENDGAFSTLRLLESLRTELAGVRVIAIQISIDSPEAYEPPHRTRDRSYLADRVAHRAHTANELLAPLYGFVSTRDGHQSAAREALRAWTVAHGEGSAYVHFRALIPRPTPARPNPAQPPLGWLLSDGSEKQLTNGTLCLDRNHAEWLRLAEALRLPPDKLPDCGGSQPAHREVDRGFPP